MDVADYKMQKVFSMTFSTFSRKFCLEKKFMSVYISAIARTLDCPLEDAPDVPMKTLVKFTKVDWMKCKGFGKAASSHFEDALERAGLSFGMTDDWIKELEESSLVGSDSTEKDSNVDLLRMFNILQEGMVGADSCKTEFKMLRPDGYTWAMTVLSPFHKDALKK